MRIQLRHLAGFSHQPVQAVALLVDDLEQVLPLRLVEPRLGQQRLGGSFDRGQGCPELVGDRIEQDRAQPVALAGSLTFCELLDRTSPFDRNRNQTADCFQAFAREIAAGHCERAYGSHSHAQWDVTNPMLAVEYRFPAIADCLQLMERKSSPARAVEKVCVLSSFDKDSGSADPNESTMLLGMRFSNSNAFSVNHSCWLRAYSLSNSRRRSSAESALRRARSESWLPTTAVTRKVSRAIQFWGSAMMKRNNGGKKK